MAPGGEFQRNPRCETYVDTRNFPAAYSTFPLKSRRTTNPLHDVKVTWFTQMCPKHKILPNLYICKKGGRSIRRNSFEGCQGSQVPLVVRPWTGRFQIIRNYYEICRIKIEMTARCGYLYIAHCFSDLFGTFFEPRFGSRNITVRLRPIPVPNSHLTHIDWIFYIREFSRIIHKETNAQNHKSS